MTILEKHVPFVNEEIAFQEKMLEKVSGNKHREEFHTAIRDKFRALLSDLIIADRDLAAIEESKQATLSQKGAMPLSPDDIDGLPDELIKELSISEADKTEFAIVALINDAGGILSLDRILIGVFKNTGEIFKRTAMTSKLYRMSQKGLVYGVPNKKGWYSTQEVTGDEGSIDLSA